MLSVLGRRGFGVVLGLGLLLASTVVAEAAGHGLDVRETTVPGPPAARAERVAVCHSAGARAHTLHLGSEGVTEHLAHGDTLGPCEGLSSPAGTRGAGTAVCHVPGGNPAKGRTLHVGAEGLIDHLAHGDVPGQCGGLPSMDHRAEQIAAFCEHKPDHRRCD